MKLQQIRTLFLKYFEAKGHTVVPSASLIPEGDDTLLFTNAGMVPFKDIFLGREKASYVRAASAQRCVRAGGKHNDLENVGYTSRHHTFFEMLGNFSFGDYFKKEAVHFAWEFLTVQLKLPKERLWVTVFQDDDEAFAIWEKEIGIPKERIIRCGEKDNFWSMGDTGPCGPCSEIFYDHGPTVAGGPPGSPDADGDRYTEIWNLVFMQFNRHKDGTLTPLPKPSVDTGMGLERIGAVMQGVSSNYDTDVLRTLIEAAGRFTHTADLSNNSLKVLADHIRATSFLMVDGIMPSNEGRGYVLRRIMRRAMRHGYQLGMQTPFFYQLVATLVHTMGEAYPALKEKQTLIEAAVLREEEQFARTLGQGIRILKEALKDNSKKIINGETAFKLYDTYGFPLDLTADIARESGFTVDESGFEAHMLQQQTRARAASQFKVDYNAQDFGSLSSVFCGYTALEDETKILALYYEGLPKDTLRNGQIGDVILETTPFYAEAGGQVADTGTLHTKTGKARVQNVQKVGAVLVHRVEVTEGELSKNATVVAAVDKVARQATAQHHSATHLLHAALRNVLGNTVVQKGSLVAPNRLRFDFTYPEAIGGATLDVLEKMVNEQVQLNTPVVTEIMAINEAKQKGAMALFGEKYGETVRVLTMGDKFSVELCGGTHVNRTGDIGSVMIVREMGVSQGVRRIEAVVGKEAVLQWQQSRALLQSAAAVLKTDTAELPTRITQLLQKNKTLEKNVQTLKVAAPLVGKAAEEPISRHNDIALLVTECPGADMAILRQKMDAYKKELGKAIIVLGATTEDKALLVLGVSDHLTDKLSAVELMQPIAEKIGGKGGGRKDMAQAGGNVPAMLSEALVFARTFIEGKI